MRAFALFCLALAAALLPAHLRAADAPLAPPPGLEIVTAGHSFHMFLPGILRELAKAGGIEGHEQVAAQSIGGSRVIQHWDRPDDKNQVKPALATGKVDVLTLSPIYLPDQGIENFVELALKHNPKIRVTLQSFWLPYDVYALDYQKQRPPAVDRNTRTAEELRKESAPYFASFIDYAAALNKKYEKEVVFIVPAGQASIALREKIIAGQAPGLKQQNDLFTDPIGHATPPLMALNAYCHYTVLYRRSPIGLPVPGVLKPKQGEPSEELVKLNRLLQELAWEACLAHPHSGVKERQ